MVAQREELYRRLAELGIETKTTEHAPVFTVEEAKKAHDDIQGGHCKNLFCKDEKGDLWLIICLEDDRVDLKSAPMRIGSRRLTFAKAELLMEILGVEPGSVTPFGLMNDKSVRTNVILDAKMMAQTHLNFHPLKNTATTTIARNDLIRFIEANGHSPRIVAVTTDK